MKVKITVGLALVAIAVAAVLIFFPRQTAPASAPDTHKKFAPRGYETVAVAVRQDHPNRVAQFAASRALPFKVALDSSGEIAERFGNVRVTPMSFLIDKQGRVLKRYLGEPDWAEFHEIVERALAS